MDHRVEILMPDLRELDLDQPSGEELSHLAYLWAVSQVLGLEDQMSVITFGDTGLHTEVFKKLLGDTAWKKMFPELPPQSTDAIPFQVRQLVGLQLRNVDTILREETHAEAREKGTKHISKVITKVRTETTKLKKSILKA